MRHTGSGSGLIASVRNTLRTRCLLQPGDVVISACSGGPDSTALSHALALLSSEFECELHLACVDHGLRPESKDEQSQVAIFAESLDLPFHPLCVEVAEGESLQSRAREARYRSLQRLRSTLAKVSSGRVVIATGHTRDDQAETVMARLLRGAGLRGLAGINPFRMDGVIRPLIDTTREQVNRYVERYSLPTIHDPSNRNKRFERVRIRLDILPQLAREDRNIGDHLANLADEARAAFHFMEAMADEFLSRQLSEKHRESISRASLVAVHPALRRIILRKWIEKVTGTVSNRSHLIQLEQMLSGRGEALLPQGWKVFVEGEHLVSKRS